MGSRGFRAYTEGSTILIIPSVFPCEIPLDRSSRSRFVLQAIRPMRIGKPLIFRQFLTSIWYPAYKVGADRSCDRCVRDSQIRGIHCDRSIAVNTRESRHEIRAHVIRDLFTFTPRYRHGDTGCSLRCEIASFVSGDTGFRTHAGRGEKRRQKRAI